MIAEHFFTTGFAKNVNLDGTLSHAFKIFMNQYNKMKPADLNEDMEPIVEHIKILEKYSYNENRYYALFSGADFSPVYVSKNIEQHGYTQQEFCSLTAMDVFKAFHWKQLSFGLKILQWFNRFKNTVPDFGRNNDEQIFFGVKLKGKQQLLKTFLFKCRWISMNGSKDCTYLFFEVEEIGNIYKSDNWWAKYHAKREHGNIRRYYFSSGRKKDTADLFSRREWEILKLIIAEKDSGEISQLLKISIETVKKHRKNMIARTGAKDTISLIQLLKIGGIIK